MTHSNKILFIAANPSGYDTIEWEKEHKAINKTLKNSQYEVTTLLSSATAKDLDDYAQNKFWLIHFSGHGTEGGKLIFEDDNGKGFIMRKDDFLHWLEGMNRLKCVFLSACDSDELADDIHKIVDYAIGFKETILNEDAIEFVKAFYESLTKWQNIPLAYREARYKLRRRKYTGTINSVFKSKYNYIMEAIFSKKTNDVRAKYAHQQEILAEIDLLETEIDKLKMDIASVKTGGHDLSLQLIKNSPYPSALIWFLDNQEALAYKLSAILLNDKQEDEQSYFADDLVIAFNFLLSSLATVDYKEFTKRDLKDALTFVVKKIYYQQALDILPTLVPPDSYSPEFVVYLRENCRYIKGLL